MLKYSKYTLNKSRYKFRTCWSLVEWHSFLYKLSGTADFRFVSCFGMNLFLCAGRKKNEIKQKEYGGYPFYVILTVLLSWKFNLSTIHRTKCRGTYVYCDGWFFINSGCIASAWCHCCC